MPITATYKIRIKLLINQPIDPWFMSDI